MFISFKQPGRKTFQLNATVFENQTPESEDHQFRGWVLQQRYDKSRRYSGVTSPGHRRAPVPGNSGRIIVPPAKSGKQIGFLELTEN